MRYTTEILEITKELEGLRMDIQDLLVENELQAQVIEGYDQWVDTIIKNNEILLDRLAKKYSFDKEREKNLFGAEMKKRMIGENVVYIEFQ